jgi:hypothetical protein
MRSFAPTWARLGLACVCVGGALGVTTHDAFAQGPSHPAAGGGSLGEAFRGRPGIGFNIASGFDFRGAQLQQPPAQGHPSSTRFGEPDPSKAKPAEREHYVPAPLTPGTTATPVQTSSPATTTKAQDAEARRAGRMTETERRQLRQNIEDAGKDVYRPKP